MIANVGSTNDAEITTPEITTKKSERKEKEKKLPTRPCWLSSTREARVASAKRLTFENIINGFGSPPARGAQTVAVKQAANESLD